VKGIDHLYVVNFLQMLSICFEITIGISYFGVCLDAGVDG